MLLLHVAVGGDAVPGRAQARLRLRAAALAHLLFTVSPLAIYYQRRLLLDNIMLFWALLSLDLLLDGWGRLRRVTLSGLCFGVALFSKETAVFLLPAMLFIAWQQRWRHQARFAVSAGWCRWSWWSAGIRCTRRSRASCCRPAGAALLFHVGYGKTGVSLVDRCIWQIARDGGGIQSRTTSSGRW